MKPVYFLSDAHLGSLAIAHRRTHERRLVNFLDNIKEKAEAVYLLGDIFDFWYEYRTVVPKGYTRLLGKISELTDKGVEVHFFTGNHDLWINDYFEQECGMIVHREISFTTEIYGKLFYLAHGDGLGAEDKKYKILRRIFHNATCKRLFSALHPRWGVQFGLNWAKHSRMKRAEGKEPPETRACRRRSAVYGRGARRLDSLFKGLSLDTRRHQLFHLRSSPYRTGFITLPHNPHFDHRRLDQQI